MFRRSTMSRRPRSKLAPWLWEKNGPTFETVEEYPIATDLLVYIEKDATMTFWTALIYAFHSLSHCHVVLRWFAAFLTYIIDQEAWLVLVLSWSFRASIGERRCPWRSHSGNNQAVLVLIMARALLYLGPERNDIW
jgi:hypothetical protein